MRALIPWVALLIFLLSGPGKAEPQDSAAQPAPPVGQGAIAALQQQLKQEGYAPGPVNGVMTDKTRQAILAYERRTGHPPEALAAGEGDPVKRAQAGLQRLGLFAGPADGVIGPQTRDAIIRFEAGRHLPVDPRVSDRLLAALEEAGAASAPANTATAAPASPPEPPDSPSATPGPTTAELPEGAPPEALGRRQLPAWVNPPPIR